MKKLLRVIAVLIVVVGIVWVGRLLFSPHGCPAKSRLYDERLFGHVREIGAVTVDHDPTQRSIKIMPYSSESELGLYDRQGRKFRAAYGKRPPFIINIKYDWRGDISEMNSWLDTKTCMTDRYSYFPARKEILVKQYIHQNVGKRHWYEKILELIHINDPGKLCVNSVVKLDSQGRAIASISKDPSGAQLHRTSTKYDAKGNPVSKTMDIRRLGVCRIELKYDSNHNIIEQRIFDRSKLTEVMTYTYKFDAKGNWTERIGSKLVKEKGKQVWRPMIITNRNIKYYSN